MLQKKQQIITLTSLCHKPLLYCTSCTIYSQYKFQKIPGSNTPSYIHSGKELARLAKERIEREVQA